MTEQGTISIFFDENRFNNSDDTLILESLQNLRILKTRETGDEQITPITTGRYEGRNISFTYSSLQDYSMRRKAEVLKYNKNRLEETKKGNYSRISNNGKSKYKHLTNNRIADIKVRNKCENANILLKPATNAGVKGDNTPLYLDQNISFFETI